MNKSLAILGYGGHAKVVANIALDTGWSEIVFFDDAWPQLSTSGRWAVSGNCEAFFDMPLEFDGVFVAIGNNSVRRKLGECCIAAGANLISLVHPSAVISQFSTIGRGVVVCAGAIINIDACVSDGTIVNTGACLDHDVIVGSYAHISPNASVAGEVVIGDEAWLGIGASVKQGLSIGVRAVVGAGAAVVCNIPARETWGGVPAKELLRI